MPSNVIPMNPTANPMQITVVAKAVYGKTIFYPVCPSASTFCTLLGQATFTPRDLKLIKELGYTISIENPVVTF